MYSSKDLPINTIVYYSTFGGSGVGKITGHYTSKIMLVDKKQTFIEDILWIITKDFIKKQLAANLPFLTWNKENIQKARDLVNYEEKKVMTEVIDNSWCKDLYNELKYKGD